MTSYATAYARAADPGVQRDALLAVTRSYLERWEWDRLAAALEVLDERSGPAHADVEAQRDRLRLAFRDRAAAATPGSVTARIADRLLVGRPTGLALATSTTLDVDGDGDLDLIALEGGELVARTTDGLAVLSRRPLHRRDEIRCAGRDDRGAYAVVGPARAPDGLRLVPLDGAPIVAIDAAHTERLAHCRWIDLDGERGDELYLLSNRALIRMTRGADDAWTEEKLAVGSEVWDVIGGDLDGDGRRELLVSIGQWRAYEVRLVRADPDGTLRAVDRVRLGLIGALADLGRDDAGRARIAALKLDVYPNVRDLPADRPLGAPAGLYVLGLAGDRLEVVRHVEVPGVGGDPLYRSASRHFPEVWPMRTADVDGDGRRDVVARIILVAERPNLLVMLGEANGDFSVRIISGVDPQAVLPRGAGRPDEIVAGIDGEAGAWILGGGTTAIPRRAAATVGRPELAPAAGLDPSIASAWQRGEHLARIGQVEAAAAALERVATRTASTSVKLAALSRAASLLTADGRSAAATFEAIAQLPTASDAARGQAWLDAIADDLAQVALIDARARAARLDDSGLTLAPADQARLAALRARVPGAARAVFDGQGLDPGWRLADPSLVHVVPGSGRLALETLTAGVVASLPLAPDPRGVAVVIEAEITRMEWAGNLVFRLGPRAPATDGTIEVSIGARGGGRVYGRGFQCGATYPSADERFDWLPDSDAVIAVRIELALIPGERRARCAIVVDGRPMIVALDVAPTASRDWAFSIEANALAATTSAMARIKSIEVTGATPTSAPSSALGDAARALAVHRAAEARALLAGLDRATAATWPAVRLAVIAADELGDRPAATAALAAALAGPAAHRPTLAQHASLARARDGQFMPVVRAAYGRRVALLLAAAWAVTAHHDLDQPRVRAALIRDLDGLPAATPETRDATLSLLGYLGEALLAAGRPDDARRALTDALALVPPGAGLEVRDRAERLAFLLAVDAAARGDEPTARRWAVASLELGNYPELAADQLLLDPGLRALTSRPGWERVAAIGRQLAPVP